MEQTGIKMVLMNRFHCCFSAQIAASAAPDDLRPQLEPPSRLAKAAMFQCRCSVCFFLFCFVSFFFSLRRRVNPPRRRKYLCDLVCTAV